MRRTDRIVILRTQIVGALDKYRPGLWAALGLTLLIGTYKGPAIRVRRSSDSGEQDIGFMDTGVDVLALAAFVGSDSAFVSKWYDQSGAGNHFANATASTQPRIVNSGAYDAAVKFNLSGSTTNLLSVNPGGATLSKSLFRKVLARARSTFAFPYEYGNASLIATASGNGQIQENDGTSASSPGSVVYMAGTGAANSQTGFGGSGPDPASMGLRAHIFTRGLSPGYLGLILCAAGASQTRNSPVDSGTPPAGNFPAWNWRLGCRTDGNGAQIDMQTCVIYDADKSADALAINLALA